MVKRRCEQVTNRISDQPRWDLPVSDEDILIRSDWRSLALSAAIWVCGVASGWLLHILAR